MNRKHNARLERVQRAVASGVGASVDDTLWLVQRIHGLQDLLRGADQVLLSISTQLKAAARHATDCRDGLETERGA